jgi:hypothetical protein
MRSDRADPLSLEASFYVKIYFFKVNSAEALQIEPPFWADDFAKERPHIHPATPSAFVMFCRRWAEAT